MATRRPDLRARLLLHSLVLSSCVLFSGCALFAVDPPTYEPRMLASGVEVIDLLVPTGAQLPFLRGGETVTVHFEVLSEDGDVLDSSLDRGEPIRFRLGAEEVPVGLEQGLIGMRELGRRRICVPPELAFGEEGVDERVPLGECVVFEVELLEVEGGYLPPPPEVTDPWWAE